MVLNVTKSEKHVREDNEIINLGTITVLEDSFFLMGDPIIYHPVTCFPTLFINH